MIADDASQSGIQFIAVFVEHHRICISVELLEREARVILLLNLLYCRFQPLPDVLHVPEI